MYNTYDIFGSMLSKNDTDSSCESIFTLQDLDMALSNSNKGILSKEFIIKANEDYRSGIKELKYFERFDIDFEYFCKANRLPHCYSGVNV